MGKGSGGKKGNVGKAALLLGAAGLLLFLVGVKRRYQVADDFSLEDAPRPRRRPEETNPSGDE